MSKKYLCCHYLKTIFNCPATTLFTVIREILPVGCISKYSLWVLMAFKTKYLLKIIIALLSTTEKSMCLLPVIGITAHENVSPMVLLKDSFGRNDLRP